MVRKNAWTKQQLLKFLELKEQGKSLAEISKIIHKSKESLRRKTSRMDWESFKQDPDAYFDGTRSPKKWTHEEMVRLDAFLQAGKPYDFIAEQLKRGYVSVERQAQQTDWQAWRAIRDNVSEDQSSAEAKSILIEQLVSALLTLGRYDGKRISGINEKEFSRKVNFDRSQYPVTFDELKGRAHNQLKELGFGNPEHIGLGRGTYIIVGDSHGKFTKRGMFKLLERVNHYLKPKKIIHIGHLLDDDNDISYDWGKFENLIVLAKVEELKIIQDQRNKFDFSYEIARESVELGSLIVGNQDIISDYVKTPISSLDSEIFDSKVVVNCHRHEFFTRCSNGESSYLASPGCLCERHIIRTIKQIDFEDGRVVKQAFHDGFAKYRRMRHMFRYWDQGMIVVHVHDDGSHTLVPCLIRKTGKGYTTSYFDKIISEKGVHNPTKKIFVNADIHSSRHDTNVLDIQEQIVKDYKPDVFVNVGDSHSYEALNHHLMDKGKPVQSLLLTEAAQTHQVMKRMVGWAKECHTIYGNHERFASDFVEKFPQFGDYLDFRFLCGIDGLGYKLTELKDVLKIGVTQFIHGDVRMYGQPGSKIEKASRTFGRHVFVGHIHRPEIRFGCYSVGLSGQMDQDYNEVNASNWMQGLGMCNQFAGKDWPTTIFIDDHQCIINNKIYRPIHPENWIMNGYKAQLVYNVE